MFLFQSTSAWLGNFSPKCVVITVHFLIDPVCILWIGIHMFMLLTIFCFSWILHPFSLSDLKSSHFSMHPYILPEIWDSCFFRFFCTHYIVHQTIDNTMALLHIRYFLNLNKFSLNQKISYKIFLESRLIRDLPESCLKCSLDTCSILKDIFLKICS